MAKLPPEFVIKQISDQEWLAINPRACRSFKIDGHGKAILDSQFSGPLLAYDRYKELRGSEPVMPRDSFLSQSDLMIGKLTERSKAHLKRLTVGGTILNASAFAKVSKPFSSLIAIPFAILALIGYLVFAPPLFLEMNFRDGFGAYWQTLTGIAVVLLSVVVHEIGHAAALSRFGRIVGPAGLGLNMIYPAMFTVVFEQNYMPRREKVWLNLSGSMFQALYGCIVAICAEAFYSHELKACAFVIFALAGFQLIPLNDSDGYWLIQDLFKKESKLFRRLTLFASLILASAFAWYLTKRCADYWDWRIGYHKAGWGWFYGGTWKFHIVPITISVIVALWWLKLTRTIAMLIGVLVPSLIARKTSTRRK